MGKPYYGFRGKSLNRAIATIAGLGFLLFGYDQGVMGGLLTLDEFVRVFPEMDTVNTIDAQKTRNSRIQGVSVAIYEIGCMAGALTTIWAGDRFGRKKVIFFGAVVMTAGAIIQAASFGLPEFIVGRIVTGFGNGFITASVPVWQSECAKAEDRGYLVMIEGALITAGIAISYWLDFAFFFVPGEASFRFPIAFQMVFSIVLMATVLQLPESPRWLVKKGRIEEARAVFAALSDVEDDNPAVLLQVEEIRATLPLVEGGAVKDIFTQGKEKHFHRACLGFWAQVMQQITGINLITYYAATIYETSIGLSPLNSKILAAANGTEYFLASFIAVFLIERVGRRKLMLFGAAAQSLTMALLTVTTYLAAKTDALPYPGKDNAAAGIVAAILLFIFNSAFAGGWLGMTWLYPAEIVSLRIRAPSAGISTAANWVFNFMVVLITPIAFDSIGYYTYTVFACINFLMVPTVYFLYPETAHRSLEEIDEIFLHSNPMTPWDVVKIANDLPRRIHADEQAHDPEAAYANSIRERKGYDSKDGEKDETEHVENGRRDFTAEEAEEERNSRST